VSDSSHDAASRSFELLDRRVQRWIWERGWTELRDIQERSVPSILSVDRDLLIGAGTGRGKTEAAFLPICSRILGEDGPGVKALYISPLKALINDQFGRMEDLCERLEIPVHRWHGDVPSGRKQKVVKRPDGILLITPESLEALFVVRGPRIPRIFEGLRYVVIDELHSFMGTERGAQLLSLMHRIELAIRRRVPRIGLSATLGDMSLAASFLRPGSGEKVDVIESREGGQEIQLQVRGYSCDQPERGSEQARSGELPSGLEIAAHLFQTLRGTDNLVFANRRTDVEKYADRLSRLALEHRVPQEFWPHHGNLSKDVREDVERMLKEDGRPTTAVCTSTLEMGIDIGSVNSIAQVGAPPNVASLRQRLGRSGRRGDPAIMRLYVHEWELDPRSPPQDSIRSQLVATIAMVNLLIEGWCEPPVAGAHHFSTLLHQVLSMITQHGGIRAAEAWKALCANGPFHPLDQRRFSVLLRAMGAADLVVQAGDGTLLLGEKGERLVNHYTFFAVFRTQEEYRVVSSGTTLGTLPINFALSEGALIIFAGRRWQVLSFDERAKVMEVVPASGGVPPLFEGNAIGFTHARVREEMLRVYGSVDLPVFLDAGARELLAEGRSHFRRFGLDEVRWLRWGDSTILFPWSGDSAHDAIALMLRRCGLDASLDGVTVTVERALPERVLEVLGLVREQDYVDGVELARMVKNVGCEKYDQHVPEELLREEYASRRLDVEGAREAIANWPPEKARHEEG